jgi:hypothetical protein
MLMVAFSLGEVLISMVAGILIIVIYLGRYG